MASISCGSYGSFVGALPSQFCPAGELQWVILRSLHASPSRIYSAGKLQWTILRRSRASPSGIYAAGRLQGRFIFLVVVTCGAMGHSSARRKLW